ncbi:hypothetical protein SLA2020_012990 [Shorea laevis]
MDLMAIFTTFITTPLVMAVYKPAKRRSAVVYKYKTIERKDTNTQLRILAYFHSARNIPTLINLIEASCGTDKREGLYVYAMHLMELSERSSAILMVHKARKNGLPFWNKGMQSDGDQSGKDRRVLGSNRQERRESEDAEQSYVGAKRARRKEESPRCC